MTCLSCHQMHQSSDDPRPVKEWANHMLKPGMRGDDACLQCHAEYADDVEAHTYHEAGSYRQRVPELPHAAHGVGADERASASTRSTARPCSPASTTGRPNACNACHLDQTLAWSAEHLAKWYGQPVPELTEEQSSVAASILWTLTGDAGQRALLAWHMGWEPAQEASGTEWMAPYLAELLTDPYDVVRFNGHRSLASLPGFRGLDYDYDYVGPTAARAAAQRAAPADVAPAARGPRAPRHPAAPHARPGGWTDRASAPWPSAATTRT